MKSLHVAFVTAVLMAVALFPSTTCNQTPGTDADISGTGTIQFVALEGGFYGILADDGHHYDPINLDQELQVDGLRIRFTAQERKDLASFHMWGDIIELVEVEKIGA